MVTVVVFEGQAEASGTFQWTVSRTAVAPPLAQLSASNGFGGLEVCQQYVERRLPHRLLGLWRRHQQPGTAPVPHVPFLQGVQRESDGHRRGWFPHHPADGLGVVGCNRARR